MKNQFIISGSYHYSLKEDQVPIFFKLAVISLKGLMDKVERN